MEKPGQQKKKNRLEVEDKSLNSWRGMFTCIFVCILCKI